MFLVVKSQALVTAFHTSVRKRLRQNPHRPATTSSNTSHTRMPTTKMGDIDAPIPPSSNIPNDCDTTSRQRDYNRSSHASSDAPPPSYGAPGTERDPLLGHDYISQGSKQLWRDSRPQLRHVPPPQESEDESNREDSDSVQTVRRKIASEATSSEGDDRPLPDINFEEWNACIGVWLLTCLVIAVATIAAVVI